MTPREILIAARARIAKPYRWTRATFARNGAGYATAPDDPFAECWCSVGAILAGGPVLNEDIPNRNRAFAALELASGANHVGHWNDDPARTHADVLAAFDKAIAMLGGAT